jgi:all-trans-retinol 13,14-reductase
MDTSTSYDVIVIGSGAGGLSAALGAANNGASVLLLEAGKQFGGYINPFARKKFHFDTGLHYVGEAGPEGGLRKSLDELGIGTPFRELSPDGFDWFVFPDYQVKMGKGIDLFHQRLLADFPHEKRGLDRFFTMVRNLNRAFDKVAEVDGFGNFLILRQIWRLLRWRNSTLSQMLDGYVRDPQLRAALAGPCGDLGLPPSRVSSLYFMAVFLHYMGGAYYPHGGSGALRDAFVEAMKTKNVDMRRSARVSEIQSENNKVVGVTTEAGDTFYAKSVISDADGPQTYRMAGLDKRSKKLARKAHQTEASVSSFMVFLGVDDTLPNNPIGDKNLWHYSSHDIDGIYKKIFDGALPSDDFLFISTPSFKDPGGHKAPEGCQTVEILAMASPKPFMKWFDKPSFKRGDDYSKLKEELAEPMIDVVESYLPGLREKIIVKEISTPATNRHFVHHDQGQIYGPAATPQQTLFRRFPTHTPIKGLYLCGASIVAGGISPAISSGINASKAAVRHLESLSKKAGKELNSVKGAPLLIPEKADPSPEEAS